MIFRKDCPTDLEQRAGRIVRRKNNYEEVDLYRYVTEGTFDAYSYQLIETKQRFISQIMTGKNPARTCDDVDATALSYSEIKALCAGDPKIKAKMDLDVEVARLETLRSGYLSEHYQLEDALTRHYPEKIKKCESDIAALEQDKTLLEANPVRNGEDFLIELEGVAYGNKELAGEAFIKIVKTCAAVEWTQAGTYRGFPLELRLRTDFLGKGQGVYEMGLPGVYDRYTAELGTDPLGNITRLNNALDRIPEYLSEIQNQLHAVREQIAPAQVELSKPWPQEAEWREKSAQLAALNAELNTDGHESGAVDPTPDEQDTRPPKPRGRDMER